MWTACFTWTEVAGQRYEYPASKEAVPQQTFTKIIKHACRICPFSGGVSILTSRKGTSNQPNLSSLLR